MVNILCNHFTLRKKSSKPRNIDSREDEKTILLFKLPSMGDDGLIYLIYLVTGIWLSPSLRRWKIIHG